MPGGGVRHSAVAGSWYPGLPDALVAEVDGLLAAAPPRAVPGRLVALVSPHAGLRYSGAVAGHAYALLAGRRALTVVLVGPSHRLAFDGVSVWPSGAYETPLGRVPIAEDLAAALASTAGDLVREGTGHRDEHSLEMQLPFLQRIVPDLRLLPILMGSQAREEVEDLARALAGVLAGRPDVLLVASSDLSHYQPAAVANALDAEVVGDVERFDADRLLERLEEYPHHACGGGPMAAVMKAAAGLGATTATILRYADSGDAGEHDKSRVVGYLAAALCGPA